ncbi:MAG: preprotein translocase subunit SecY [Planctomycetaceae bacterium]|jgi:preprotein translocase subunit SecY|nr:preprotein translocase subunit SecY [Planctomycetaceae bacterium]MBT6153964.1 preprotein translocase subunit SecY [Planctomycetaceae bacterium]MBT6483734.1 preprotein translocase subunit SecY [Planctomycetaceae bacterium]MBT6497000.1 preprotein translocase subunit SecY [Planctomycetaceae bacterium]
MLSKLFTVFKIPELRQKILLTLFLLAVYRMGFAIPLPFIDQEVMNASIEKLRGGGGLGSLIQMVSLFSASNIGNSTIFGLGIMPYISASIIFQLLGSVYPPLEKLQKEGEAGRRKINEYTRYATVLICLVQSYFWIKAISGGFGQAGGGWILKEYDTFAFHMVCTVVMTTGTLFLMWIGEQVDAYGIGNGISLLIMAGILARMPAAAQSLIAPAFTNGVALGGSASGAVDPVKLLMLACLFVGVVIWIIAITQGQRRIPIQSAKHVRGRRVMGGQRQSLPLRVNQAGVMPIIFASSLLMFPMFIFQQAANWWPFEGDAGGFYQWWSGSMDSMSRVFGADRGFVYNLCYIGLIYFFCYFWTAITFNPKDMAENLKDYGSFIPGYRPGARTASYLESVMVRITYVGAAFLALVAVIPTIIAMSMGIDFLIASFYGGTGLLIVVSVALDLVQKIDSHLVMRNYSGLLEAEE